MKLLMKEKKKTKQNFMFKIPPSTIRLAENSLITFIYIIHVIVFSFL